MQRQKLVYFAKKKVQKLKYLQETERRLLHHGQASASSQHALLLLLSSLRLLCPAVLPATEQQTLGEAAGGGQCGPRGGAATYLV